MLSVEDNSCTTPPIHLEASLADRLAYPATGRYIPLAGVSGARLIHRSFRVVKLPTFDQTGGTVPQHVLITRLSAIGDCILTLPLAVKIKQLWPDCRITWAVDCAAATLLEEHPAIDEVFRVPKDWLAQPKRWHHLRSQLRQRQFDLVFDPQGLCKSSLLGRLSGSKLRVGFDYSHARELAPWAATHRIRRSARHMVDTYLQLLSPWCQVAPGSGEFQMPVFEQAAQRVEQKLQDLELSYLPGLPSAVDANSNSTAGEQRWVAMNVGAGWVSRRWSPERYGWIAQQLWQRHSLRSLVLWAGDEEHAMAEQVVTQSAGAAIAAPPTTLRELVEVIRRCELLITGDTSPLHMASAVKAPCVGLFGSTWADEGGPYGNQHIAIQSTILPDKRRRARRTSTSSINAIEISEVLHGCSQLIAKLQSSASQRTRRLAA